MLSFKDYSITSTHETLIDYYVNIYPNPAKYFFNIENSFPDPMKLNINNINGQLIYTDDISGSSKKTINVEHLTPGLYFINLYNNKHNVHYKVLVSK